MTTPPPDPPPHKRSPWRWALGAAPSLLMLVAFVGASFLEKERVPVAFLMVVMLALVGLGIIAGAFFSFWLAAVMAKNTGPRVILTILFTVILCVVSLLIALSGCAVVYPPDFR